MVHSHSIGAYRDGVATRYWEYITSTTDWWAETKQLAIALWAYPNALCHYIYSKQFNQAFNQHGYRIHTTLSLQALHISAQFIGLLNEQKHISHSIGQCMVFYSSSNTEIVWDSII